MSQPSQPDNFTREHYRVFYPITTRWHDNDIYGHVNNVTYYSYFDSAVNRYLIEEGGLDIHNSDVVGFVVNSSCDYRAPLAYPQQLEAGIRVEKLGNSSVVYRVGIFRVGANQAAASGSFTHVFVARAENHSVPIPEAIRQALSRIG
ncbi:acyl-CoA thioesterase [Microbulbifer hydrolyticus]|uniref:Acyl-CoA thioester hydrolase n=1 Tax=Microbulbifer hydrolyticus TaxID=48074 RepID=A0A6P1T8H9_9GAMM|nr:thioesterase family protein [Microbulbifer hydrolyticus]MBB5211298.1 acyl-CoA thioester hydrolase [Microbulbifer hydrolyticus]QHQ37940.1 acyl-CoA thioesterase [Microbulbifer hydrolyticus]